MTKSSCITSLVTLILLGCSHGIEVKAQDSIWQKKPATYNSGPPPQSLQFVPLLPFITTEASSVPSAATVQLSFATVQLSTITVHPSITTEATSAPSTTTVQLSINDKASSIPTTTTVHHRGLYSILGHHSSAFLQCQILQHLSSITLLLLPVVSRSR